LAYKFKRTDTCIHLSPTPGRGSNHVRVVNVAPDGMSYQVHLVNDFDQFLMSVPESELTFTGINHNLKPIKAP